VPNIPGVVARTATYGFLNAAWPYIQALANLGIEAAIASDAALRRGVVTHNGRMADGR
jgi:alanine dehydrogenase